MYSEVIALVAVKEDTDIYGGLNDDDIISSREVFAELRSIGATEVFQAEAAGFKPEKMFVLADYMDYEEEDYLIHEGKTYNIYRHYRKPESVLIELYVKSIVNKGGL